MIPRLPGPPRDQLQPRVLVADEDAQVVELLSFALTANHFRVLTAADGEAALQLARSERPDLVLLSVRLSRRGGLELCELLRREPEHGEVPILLLSPAGDTQSRVEALAHGADDFMTKPFSPKELVARVQRLLARARDAARHRQRNTELERDIGRLQLDAVRARDEAARERTLRALTDQLSGELLRTLDLDTLDARLLREACRLTGARSAALLARMPAAARTHTPDGVGEQSLATRTGTAAPAHVLGVHAVRGDVRERWEGLQLDPAGGVAEWLQALARPLHRDELERLSDPPPELQMLAALGVALLVALRGPAGVEAVLVCEDRADGAAFSRTEREHLGALCEAAAPARATAQRFRDHQDRALGLLAAPASSEPQRRSATDEACARLTAAAQLLGAPESDRQLLERALELGPWGWSEAGCSALAAFAASDPTRRVQRLCDLLSRARACAAQESGAGEDVLALLAAAGLRYQSLRLSGRSAFESWRTSAAWLGVHADPQLRDSFPEAIEPAR